MVTTAASTRTIGVALPVPEPWRSQLADARAAYGDPLAELVTPHVTLLPPTAVATADLPAIREHLQRAADETVPFEIVLRGTGTFQPVSPVVYVALARGVASCESLERRVRSGPLARELRFPYHPHVTLAHGVSDMELGRAFREFEDFAVTFRVTAMWLYEQREDGSWEHAVHHHFLDPD